MAARGPELRPWPWGNEKPDPAFDQPVQRNFRGFQWDAENVMNAEYAREFATLFNLAKATNQAKAPKPLSTHLDPSWMSMPVGSYPSGATPQGIYDMLGYYQGEWCRDVYLQDSYKRAPDAGLVQSLPDINKEWRVVRGLCLVPVDHSTYKHVPIANILMFFIPTDGKARSSVDGRSWSRDGQHVNSYATFRVAMTAD